MSGLQWFGMGMILVGIGLGISGIIIEIITRADVGTILITPSATVIAAGALILWLEEKRQRYAQK